MRKLLPVLLLLMVAVMAMAQSKWTPQAINRVSKVKKMRASQVAKAPNIDGQMQLRNTSTTRLSVQIAQEHAAQTFAQLKAAGAEIQARWGDMAVISLPIDSADALGRISGVVRIDGGRGPQWKTDVVRQETGVTLIDGSTTPADLPMTGKGVTICLIDIGFDFQHRAFKDNEGRSRIKAVYRLFDKGGNPFTVEDPEAGTITFPGSVYDTPELIASLTTDTDDSAHGTHTAGIAAGSVSPMGFGGMAPEADIVLIPIPETDNEGNEVGDPEFQTCVQFAASYARKYQVPMVLSVSANSHEGPHDGTGSMSQLLRQVSKQLIPVFSVGNEGDSPIHIHKLFTESEPLLKAMLPSHGLMGKGEVESGVAGYTRAGGEISVQVALYNRMSKKVLWESAPCTVGPETETAILNFYDDEQLAGYFDGDLFLAVGSVDGKPSFSLLADGDVNTRAFFTIAVSGTEGTEIDLWEQTEGFEQYGSDGFSKGDSDLSAGDWTSIDEVISVGAYCANNRERTYSSATSYGLPKGAVMDFSSYGTMLNGVSQPMTCAPGVFIVSSWNRYEMDDDVVVADNMQWEGFPYSAETGTSMACPVVSGIVALWLQADPSLTLADIQNVLRESSRNDEYTLASPARAGYGKVDAAKGLEYILSSGIRDLNQGSAENVDAIYDLQGRRIKGVPSSKGIYIRGNRKYVSVR